MADRSDRHRDTPTFTRAVGGREVELYEPRTMPLDTLAARHEVTGDDRLDALAWRYYSDPHQYWRIADANPTEAPEDLLEPGRVLLIPRGG